MNPVPPGYHAPFEVLTKNDHTARIEILAALGLVISIVFLGFRMFSRHGKFANDDLTLFAATAVGVIQSGVTIVACRTGLGKRSTLLNEMTQHSVQQITYASTLLLIITVGLLCPPVRVEAALDNLWQELQKLDIEMAHYT
ncbi:hypothetical protein KC331_g9258 [Hortaea werneckii]|nr:hypothetical protein KC320_g9126 [Hortaea werneckii]KAI7540281.1 hypothetical protein KC331_g9258 [Hortaea werneckii]